MLLKDRYRATDFLGAGGMGRNFLAIDEDTPSKKRCVIKQFSPHPDIVSNPTAFEKAVELFNREAAMLDRLGDESAQIPRLLAYLEQDKRLYFVQEFIDGQNLLKELEEKGIYKEAQIYQLLNDLLPVLKFIHERDVIHRDIKPENIMRRQNGQLVLIDFGISKELSGTVSSLGTTVGTLGYAPPEQMTYGVAYPASDIYALGVTCIHLMTNVCPDKLFNPQENRWLWRNVLASNNIDISQQLENILEKMLKTDLGERYKSVDEIVKDLNPIMVGIWYGEFDNAPASLTITDQLGNSFSGVLTVQYSKGLSRIEIKGNLDHKTNNLNIKEIRVLSEPERGVWVLGKNKGQLSSNKKQISGTGEGYSSYSWSFSKAGENDEIWYGEFENYPATLFIHRHSDEYFDGTLAAFHSNGLTYVAIQGNVNIKTNQVTIQEDSMLPQSRSFDWTLGKNRGIMSLDGKKMIGKGHAPPLKPYWWSFSKEDMNSFS
ncbi:MAG TPA: serine/threonine-protein kinase [Leptolyngbyaceae cyanobacterium]|nr:serine/threonine-protein kinase [Nostocaceae cyanobacterium]